MIDVFFSVINLIKQAIKLYDNYRITVYINRYLSLILFNILFSLSDFKHEYMQNADFIKNLDYENLKNKDNLSGIDSKQENQADENDNKEKREDKIPCIEDYKECSICLEQILIGKKLHCGHIHHLKCLK